MTKRYSLIICVVLLTICLFSVAYTQKPMGGYPDFELVESIPIETNLDNPDIRNTQEVWLEMFQNAKKSIDIEEFYFSNLTTEVLEPVIQSIIDAGNRGVNVRVISDSRFYSTYPETLDRLKNSKNISVRIIDFGKLDGGIMHAKYFIVDNEQVFLGSQNFDWRSLEHIHEIGVRIKNIETARIYTDLFDLDWQLAEKNDPNLIQTLLVNKQYDVPITLSESSDENIIFTPVYSPTGMIPDPNLWDEKRMIDMIDSAKKEIVMQVLTYSPEIRNGYFPDFDNALRRAASRGVKVKMIVSDWAKRKPQIYFLKSLGVIPNIEVKLSTIPPWSGGHISYARVEHCKYLVADSEHSWVGSSNWEKSYFFNTRNIGVIIDNSQISSRLQQIFMKDWNGDYTYLLKPEVEYTPPKIGD